MPRGLALLGLVLCVVVDAIAQPRIDLTATPAWKGWTRPGRATEIAIRVAADAATPIALDVAAGGQSVHADLDLLPGRVMRLHVPAFAAEKVAVSAGSPSSALERRDVELALSESPLLGAGLASVAPVELEGFHTIALTAEDLPRNASAYASIDALVVDAPTLGALDPEQLGALLAYAADCGRIVLLDPDSGVRRVLDGAAGCAGRALMSAATSAEATDALAASLAAGAVPAASMPSLGDLVPADLVAWNRVLVAVAGYFTLASLAILFVPWRPALLALPAVAAIALVALLPALQPAPQLVVWSEGVSGARGARYEASQRFPGLVRGRARVPLLAQLAGATSCDPKLPMRFVYDAGRGRSAFAEFDTRLFRQVAICYAGSFPLSRSIGIAAGPDGALEVRNTGGTAWPGARLVADGRVHDLAALGPGDAAFVRTRDGRPVQDAPERTAMARTGLGHASALWQLDLAGVAGDASVSKGWHLVTTARP